MTTSSSSLDPKVTLSVSTLTAMLLKLCPAHIFQSTELASSAELPSGSKLSSNRVMIVSQSLAKLLISYVNWQEHTTEASTNGILGMLCSLPSFRSLQKKLYTWFHAVPRMLDSVLTLFPNGQASNTEFAVKLSSSQSLAPLSLAEGRLLGSLLISRSGNVTGGSASAGGNNNSSLDTLEEEQGVLDVKRMTRIQAGDILHTAF
jgi:hypothetical protein